jgi:hypothetical protein
MEHSFLSGDAGPGRYRSSDGADVGPWLISVTFLVVIALVAWGSFPG